MRQASCAGTNSMSGINLELLELDQVDHLLVWGYQSSNVKVRFSNTKSLIKQAVESKIAAIRSLLS